MFNRYKTLELKNDNNGVSHVIMNRPDVHNAFNAKMIEELTAVFNALNDNKNVQVICLSANGKSFSAGADINWMKSMAQATEDENKADSEKLAALMRTINFNAKATIAKVQGLALGGGVGLACCCDLVVAETDAKFGLTEAKLGLVPAVISPYVIDAIGTRKARRYFQTAEIFDAQRAKDLGIVSEVMGADEVDAWIDQQLKLLNETGPNAKEISKKLVMSVVGRTLPQQKKIDEYTTQVIAAVRVSAEGQKGLNAFLNKEKINW
ncbi:enoyl-CoA hydratase-related protein [Marinicella sp. S1101]|uniref:enoyl-CoA hydratase-related protein n=1 Tax=Marinicella marina TaxID=2996016 RepID=UPI002260BBF5|nr:enoyl-CoA hydratase-related protein [Marinicella marina]MCX7554073.1 enoyl-CoA hydratase-related protein [Marinicella marina]MDJ1141234.1 enoyl-CoA hydratase-related protein [Marinicella marina]